MPRSLRVALAALSLTTATAALAAPVPGGVELRASGQAIRVVALADDVVRVELAGRDGRFPEAASWAVVDGARNARAPVRATADGFTAGALSVSVDPRTLGVTVRRGGKLLVADAPGGYARTGDAFRLAKAMPQGQHIYALGDKTGGLDRAGKSFTMWNTDAYGFSSSDDPIYKSIPFYIATGPTGTYGLLLDNTFRTSFDFGHSEPGRIAIGADGGPARYYIIAGNSVGDVVRRYGWLTGISPLQSKWAFGYQQSRYSYMSEAEVRTLVDRFAAERFPLDVVWFDIDYQDRNRPFTVNRTTFPTFEKMIGDLKARGIHSVPIVDLHVAAAANQGYAPYDSGMARNAFVHRADGQVYVAPVWPGPSVFPDFTDDKVRAWWGPLFKPFVDAGVGGIWNDMNEPAVFDTPTKTMPLDNIHRIAGDGFAPRTATHAEIHNVFGMENTRATTEGLLALAPNLRPFVMTRASYAGGQRYAATWTGDNSSSWDHLKLAVAQTLNLGMSGFAYTANDVGGFTGGPSPDLLTKWFEYATFMPLFRDHSAKDTPRAEPWVDGPEQLAIRKRFVEERYRLLPYFYAVAEEASRSGDPIMRPLFYDNAAAADLPCEPAMSFTVGRDLLVSGAAKPESPQPYRACLPAGGWYDYWTGRPVASGANAPMITPRLDQLPVYVRAGAILPRQAVVQHVGDTPDGPLMLDVYEGPDCAGSLYDDDGVTRNGPSRRQAVACARGTDGALEVRFAAASGGYRAWWRQVAITAHLADGSIRRAVVPASDAATTVRLAR
ncbi:TIM-barrel domain-containing protein [Sphingomonas sp. ASV193]|uniref:glycoside hydrolase family 31 protein n=1 Tax=Sphingomonas sp. ASV193 TaxID=3144405 RepID=UPI0032E902BB